jgi:hypothetical protein
MANKTPSQVRAAKNAASQHGVSASALAGSANELGMDPEGVVAFIRRLYAQGQGQEFQMAENTRAAAQSGQ